MFLNLLKSLAYENMRGVREGGYWVNRDWRMVKWVFCMKVWCYVNHFAA